jgi:hypothetical protein
MAGIIARCVGQLKQYLPRFLHLDQLALLGQELGLAWKNTPLALPNLVALFVRQILCGNCSMPELARMAGGAFTPEAYCTAKTRLPLELLKALLARLCQAGRRQIMSPAAGAASGLWKGHRLWHIDGTSFSMPDTPELQQRFGQPSGQQPGCGFPVAHLLCLFDAASGLIQDCILSRMNTHDMTHARKLHPELETGDLLIGDTAFEGYAHAALLVQEGKHLLAPAHCKRKLDFKGRKPKDKRRYKRIARRRMKKLGACDQVTRWAKPREKPAYMTQAQFQALPEFLDVREVKRTVRSPAGRRRIVVLITTLLDPQAYPAEELVALLEGRWQIEVNLRHLKTTMGMEILRSQSSAGIEKELGMFLVVYNLVRLVMLQAAVRQAVGVSRIGFADALYWVRHRDLTEPMPRLEVIPLRQDRPEPRVLKRRPKPYPRIRKPRHVLQKKLRGESR